MKKAPFILILLITLIAELLACCLLLGRVREVSADPVKVNECMHSIQDNYGNESEYNRQLDYVILDSNGDKLFETRSGLAGSVNEAIRTRGLILDLEIDGNILGKVIFDYSIDEDLGPVKRDILITITVISIIQILVVVIWYVYIQRAVITPFRKLNSFAARVAEGNLDLPLDMDKGHIFGEFTESFDLMRHELKKARIAEKKANDDKKEVIAKLSHDIKTPVASIKSTSEMGMALTKEDRTKEMFGIIDSKTDQIKTLVDNLSNSSVNDITEIEVNPGSQPSGDIPGMLKASDYLGRLGDITVPSLSVYFDKLRLQQVFDNIFMNSYKYADTKMHVTAEISEPYLVIRISDEGPGVKEEELPLLKERFARGSNAEGRDGAGLGLYLASCFMDKMDGKLGLRNLEPGFEVSVYIRLV